jgi:membrane-associated phospholipid phosphatase
MMGAWLESLVPWGTEAIVWAQSHSSSGLDALWVFFTYLGYEEFYLFVLPLVYWCIHKEIGIALAYVSLFSTWLNSVLKHLLRLPRPSDPRLRIPRPETSPSFPSNHAQGAVANWGYLAHRFGRLFFWGVALVAILGIGLSRIFLGVHYPQDVLAGWLIGILVVVAYAWVEPRLGRWLGAQATGLKLSLAVLLPLVLIFLHPADTLGRYPANDAVTSMSALIGLGVGVIMERSWLQFEVRGTWWQRLLRFLVGIAVVAVLYLVPSQLVPEDLPHGLSAGVRFMRYALVGWAIAYLVPFLFVRLGLAQRRGRSPMPG